MKTKLFITGLAFMALATFAGAQNSTVDQKQQNTPGKGLAYVDENKNGICDNFENRTTIVPVGNRNGNCRCFVQGKQRGQGFGQGMGRVMGPGKRMAGGQGRSGNFVDANKNGVCDYREASQKK